MLFMLCPLSIKLRKKSNVFPTKVNRLDNFAFPITLLIVSSGLPNLELPALIRVKLNIVAHTTLPNWSSPMQMLYK